MNILKIQYKAPDAPTQFANSLHQIGFAVLTEPPIPRALIDQTYQEWQRFFSSEEKYHYKFDPKLQSGYFPLQSEQAKGYSSPDLKEFFHLYSWSKLPAGISDTTWDFFNCLVKLAEELLGWIENASPSAIKNQLTMPLSSMIEESQATLLRPIHYPPLTPTESQGAIRAAAHEDINLITLLPAATAIGLEIQDNQGNWYEVPSNSGDLVVNVGDMLQMASQGYYRSTTHRVVNPTGDLAQTRFSMPLFLHPRSDVVLSGTVTARSYLWERLREIGLLSPEQPAGVDGDIHTQQTA